MRGRKAGVTAASSGDRLHAPRPAEALRAGTGEQAASRIERILVEARRLVASGALEAVTGVGVLHARHTTGEATTDLMIEMGNAPSLLHTIHQDPGDVPALLTASHRLHLEQLERRRMVAEEVCTAVRDRLHGLGAAPLLVGSAIAASGGPRPAGPLVTVVLSARGADATEQLIRLDASHPHDVADNVSRIVGRHRAACLVAADRGVRDVAWEADEVALRIVMELGGKPGDVRTQLERRHRVTFRLPGGQTGSLHWRDFTLTAELRQASDWRYQDGILVVPSQSLPEAVLASMPGNALGSFVSVHPSLDAVRVSSAEAHPLHGLRIDLDPRRTGFAFARTPRS